MKYKIRDEYAGLKDFILRLPSVFEGMGGVIRDYRNVIKIVEVEGYKLVIKNFRGMYFFNRLAYSLFRKSKAVRSYEYSERLNQHGIATPSHVAWINLYSMGMLQESYFVSVFTPLPTLEQCMDNFDATNQTQTRILEALAAFSKRLHELGIFHYDFSVGNILVKSVGDGYEFSLLDLNRMRFGPVIKGYKNFATLNLPTDAINILLRSYGRLNDEDPDHLVDRFWKYKNRKASLRRARKKLRKHTVTRLENILGKN